MEKGGGRRRDGCGFYFGCRIQGDSGETFGGHSWTRSGGGGGDRSDNSDNKYAGFTNYGARLGRRPAHEKSGALRDEDFAHKFARSNTFVSRARRDGSKPSARFVAEAGVSRRAHTVAEEREAKRKGKRESRNV